MKLIPVATALFGLVLLATAEPAKEDSQKSSASAAPATVKVQLKTNHGNILLELDRAKAPVTVDNFRNYVEKKHYDGTVFHRVIDGFMIQGGGFALDGGRLIEKPTGATIRNECRNGLKNLRGTIAMARRPDPDSASAQFFINVSDNAALDYPNNGGYAVFGKVIEGMNVVDKIKSLPTTTAPLEMRHPSTGQTLTQPSPDVPSAPVVIETATIVP